MAGTSDHASTKTKIDRDVIVQLSSSSPAASSKRSSTDSFSNPNVAKRRVLPLQLCHALGQLRNSPPSACLLARRDVRVPLLSHATVAISFFSGSGAKQWLLQRTSTGTGEPSSKHHPVHCAKMSHRQVVAQPGSLKQPVNLTCSNLTTCLDKRSLSNLTQARRQQKQNMNN